MTDITIDLTGNKSLIIGEDCNGITRNIWLIMSTEKEGENNDKNRYICNN
jgi:hypothetical protein